MLRGRQRKAKFGALSRDGFNPDSTAIGLDYPLTNSESDACPRIRISVESLEDAEHLLRVFKWDSEAIILDREQPNPIAALGSDFNRRRILSSVFDCVSDEVLKQLNHPDRIRLNHGQVAPADRCPVFIDRDVEV